MTVRQAVRASLNLLPRRDRRILVLVAIVQMSTALLDLVGVLLIGVVTALALSAVGGGTPPAMVQSLIDRFGLADADLVALSVWLAVIAGLVLVSKSVINMLLTRRVLQFLANRQAVVAGRLAGGLLSQPLMQIQQRSSQETAYALTTGTNAATLTVLGQGTVVVSELVLLGVLAVGLLVLSPVVTLFTVLYFLAIALVLQRVLSGWAGRLGQQNADAEIDSYSTIQEALRTYREAVVSDRRGLYVRRFRELRGHTAQVQSDAQFVNLVPKYVFEVALIVGAGLLAASQLLTKDATAALSVIAVFLVAGSRIVPSMLRLQGAVIMVRNGAGLAEPTYQLARSLGVDGEGDARLPALGEVDPDALRSALAREYEGFTPAIEVRDLWLQYPGAHDWALEGVTLSLPAGSSLALVGPTGAGKSTLADAVLGVLEPGRGSVTIDGLDPATAVGRWPGAVAYVPQDVVMADGSVRQNVALGLPDEAIDDDRVWEALERAHLADFLRSARDGLDTVVGEHGIKLSGGQRQRLGVARALYTRPRLLVLDEATSALDAETEDALAAALRALEGQVTTVTVAHRLATIRHCDVVVYLEGGRLVAQGSFDEVRRQAPHFDQQATLLGL